LDLQVCPAALTVLSYRPFCITSTCSTIACKLFHSTSQNLISMRHVQVVSSLSYLLAALLSLHHLLLLLPAHCSCLISTIQVASLILAMTSFSCCYHHPPAALVSESSCFRQPYCQWHFVHLVLRTLDFCRFGKVIVAEIAWN
jgi:hypothetical protein